MPRQIDDWIEGYIDYTSNSEPPYTYHLWSAISVISAVLQRKCTFTWGSLTFYPNMYVVLVGPSGETRKGTAMDFAMGFLEDIGISLAAEATTREALIKALLESKDNVVDAAGGSMIFHSSLTIWAQELAVFLGYQNQQLISDLTDWYDCRKIWTYRTKTMGTDRINGVYVTIYGATTPDLIRTSLPVDVIGGGLASRIIYVYEERKGKLVPYPEVGAAQLKMEKKLINDLQLIHMLRGNFKPTSDYLEKWIVWYTAQESNPPFRDPNFSGYIARRPNHIMKLSMILSASRSDDKIITGTDLDRALKILTLTERNMTNTFRGVGKSPNSDTMSAVMTEIALRETITVAELLDIFYRDADEWAMDKIVKTLVKMNFCKRDIKGTDEVLTYNPDREEEEEDGNPA